MYCSKCGKEIADEAVICVGCGCPVKPKVEAPVSQPKEKASSKASIVLGIIGIVIAWFFALAGHIVSIIGIILGIKDYKKTEKMTGLILSIIGEVCSIFSSIVGAVMFSAIF